MKTYLKVIFERLYKLRLLHNYMYDMKRYYKYSRYAKNNFNQNQLLGKITAYQHVVEKGLSLTNPRVGFGQSVIKTLVSDLRKYIEKDFDTSNILFLSGVNAIRNYIIFNQRNSYKVEMLIGFAKEFENFEKHDSLIHFQNFDSSKYKMMNYRDLANSRYSVRQFGTKKVDMSLIIDSIKIAQKSPSVCNRQSTRIYVVDTKETKELLLKIHNGSKGFGLESDLFLLVASDLSVFDSTGERNQTYIDGGIFTMSLLNALQYNEIATCTLNWSTTKSKDKEFRDVLNINPQDTIITIIACGSFKKDFSVAKSIRKEQDDITYNL